MCQILVIDDDSLQRTSLQAGLRRFGHEVHVAENGLVALKTMRDGKLTPALVITDIVMPEMDGLEVIRHFRTHFPGVPLVAMSGELPEAFLHLAKRLGARTALAKPVRAEQVQAVLEEILSATT